MPGNRCRCQLLVVQELNKSGQLADGKPGNTFFVQPAKETLYIPLIGDHCIFSQVALAAKVIDKCQRPASIGILRVGRLGFLRRSPPSVLDYLGHSLRTIAMSFPSIFIDSSGSESQDSIRSRKNRDYYRSCFQYNRQTFTPQFKVAICFSVMQRC